MKYAFYCLMVFFCIWAGTVLASPVGNIADPACLTTGLFSYERPNGVFASLEGDFVSDRKYLHQDGDFTLNTFGARIGGIIRDKLMIYGFAGLGEYSDSKVMGEYLLASRPYRNESISRLRIETDPSFIYGVGVTAIMFEHKVDEGVFFRVGLDASYRRIQLEDDQAILAVKIFNRADTTTRGAAIVSGANYELNLNDFQGALEISYQVDEFIPYLGFLMIESRGDETVHVVNDSYYDYNEDIAIDENKGFFAGISYNYNNWISLNAEARMRTETAFTFSTVMRF